MLISLIHRRHGLPHAAWVHGTTAAVATGRRHSIEVIDVYSAMLHDLIQLLHSVEIDGLAHGGTVYLLSKVGRRCQLLWLVGFPIIIHIPINLIGNVLKRLHIACRQKQK